MISKITILNHLLLLTIIIIMDWTPTGIHYKYYYKNETYWNLEQHSKITVQSANVN